MSHPPTTLIRLARLGDVQALVALHRESAEFHKTLDEQLYRIPEAQAVTEMFSQALGSSTTALFVAEVADQLVGYSQVQILPPANASSMLQPHRSADIGLAVAAAFRRRGVGRELMQVAYRWAVEHGAEIMQLDCHASNARALRLYEKLGYQIIGHFMIKRFQPVDTPGSG